MSEFARTTGIPRCGIDLIKTFEGCEKRLPDGRVEAYPDPIHGWGRPTIGYGTTRHADGLPVKQGDIMTQAQAEAYLIWDLTRRCKPALERIPTWDRMNDNQRGALYSFAYNLGASFYGKSRFRSISNVCDSPSKWGEWDWIEEQFVKYRNPGTPAEAGLRRRRTAEAVLFCTQPQAA